MRLPRTVARRCTHRHCLRCGGSGFYKTIDGAWAAELRTHLGLSVRDIADRMDVSKSYLHDLERGKRRFTPALWKRYEKALGTEGTE